MLKRCALCGKPVYASTNSCRTECGYCYAKVTAGNLESLPPSELDWRKPLYDAAVLMPPGEIALQRFTFLGDYKHAAQRIEFCEREIALKRNAFEPASATQEDAQEEVGRFASQVISKRRGNAARQDSAIEVVDAEADAEAPRACEANPFNVLSATPRNTREELVMLQKDEALFGNGQKADDALATLTHPDSRLEAEMHWFPRATTEETRQLLGYLGLSREGGLLPAFVPQMSSALAQFNAVKLILDAAPIENAWDFRAHILSLATLADALLPEQVMDEINADREQASFASIQSSSQIETHVENLLNETLSLVFARKPHSLTRNEIMSLERHFNRSYRSRNSTYHNSFFVELASDLLAVL